MTVVKKEETTFSFGIPLDGKIETDEKPLTSAMVEEKINETIEPKKRGRKPGSTNKKTESIETPEYVKQMFGPLVVGIHNGLLKVLKLSAMDKEQEKSVTDGYAMLLHKRIPTIIENHGDIIAAVGASAYVFFAKISTETKIFEFGKVKENTDNAKQHNDDIRPEGERENPVI